MDKNEDKDKKKEESEDERIDCKYGADCYQKNPDHHKKYKHPPRNKESNDNDDNSGKKRKSPDSQETSSTETPITKKQNVSSDSEPVSKFNDENSKTVTTDTKEKENITDTKEKDKTTDTTIEKEKITDSKEKITDSKEKITDSKEKITDSKEKITDSKEKKIIKDTKEKEKEKEKEEDPYSEAKKLIVKIFLVSMPSDFYKFYDFCNELKPSDPSTAFKIADVKLVGPYDILNGVITKNTPDQNNLVTHWRYYYDPPEFQTILKGNDKEGLHFGYWRDRPSSDPVFVATNCSNVSHKIKPIAENVFGAITSYLEERAKKANPFEKTGFFNLLGKLKVYAKTHNISLETQSPKMKSREKNVVARTIHGAGIVCPYNKKSQLGYRELSVTDNQLLKIVKKIDDAKTEEERSAARAELGEVVRLATIAGDECDFGTCLELGHDLLSTGCVHVQTAALAVLSIAYNQLERQAFLKIVETHMKNRKKGTNNSAVTVVARECITNLF